MLATNKLRQRERLAEAGVPQPRFWVVGGEDALPAVSFPCVVKAPDQQGQKGLSLVDDAGRARRRVDDGARRRPHRASCSSRSWSTGPEVTVVGFSVGGVFTALTVTDRIVAEPPAFGVALAHVFPERGRRRGRGRRRAAVAALGITDGPSYTQLRLGPDGPRVIEVAARLGGGHDAELVEAVTGVPLNDLAIDAALGEPVAGPAARAAGRRRRDALPGAPGGRARSRSRCPTDLEGVERVRIYREPGPPVHARFAAAPTARARCSALGASRGQAVSRADAAAERIRFTTADDGDLR